MLADIVSVSLRTEYGLYRLMSSSSTVYYVRVSEYACDVLRARGGGGTMTGRHDNQWLEVRRVVCGPILWREGEELPPEDIDSDDTLIDVLRVGSRHRFEYHVPGGYLDASEFWMTGRVCERIELLAQMPPEGQWTRLEGTVDRPEDA